MVFSRKTHLFFISLLIIAIIIYLLSLWKQPQYKGRGYCTMTNEYVYPEQYDNFIDYDDCQNIIKTATPLFSESQLVSGGTENIRKSQTAWLPKDDPVVKKLFAKHVLLQIFHSSMQKNYK